MITRTIWLVRGWLILLTVMFAYLIVTSRQESRRNSDRINSVCKSFASAGNLDVLNTTPINGIAFVVLHRNGAIHLGCGNLLNKPSDTLVNKANQFHLHMDG